ncbi:MAG: acylphosphatase [Phycisphaeraceae bacterium]
MTPTPKRIRVIYAGDVQGVGFRFTAARLAQAFPITGFVRNLPDGTVQLEAQGSPSDLDAFRDRLAHDMTPNIQHTNQSDIPLIDEPLEQRFEILT